MLEVDEKRTEPSRLDAAVARFEADNDGLVLKTRRLLARVADDPRLHARLINTLSLLEHTGSHKIMSTQHGPCIERSTLKHVAEEAHHAFFMKRQAEKVAGRALAYSSEELLAPAAARMYFQRLEAGVVRRLGSERRSRSAYLYMSMIVEFRALWFYRLYQQTLTRARHTLSLKRIIGEERGHLAEMADRLEIDGELSDDQVDAFLDIERALYRRMLNAFATAAG
jgi:hypothetical protein